MKRMRIFHALAFLAALAAEAAAQDIIKFKDSSRADAETEITKFNYKVVEYILISGGNRVPQKIDAKEIREIVLDNDRKGAALQIADIKMNRDDFAAAATSFERAKKDPRTPPVFREYASIGLVRAHFHGNDFAKALAEIKAYRAEFPEGFYLRETYEDEFRSHMARGDARAAEGVVNQFLEKGKSEGLQDWTRSAELSWADTYEAQGKWREALAIHKKYLNDKDPETSEKANLGEFRCLRGTGDWPTSQAKAKAVIENKKNKSDRLLMAAYTARGEANLNAGKFKEAILDFVQTISKGATCREHEIALAKGAVACARFAAAEKDRDKKMVYRGRAADLLSELKAGYPGTSFKEEVEKSIAEVK